MLEVEKTNSIDPDVNPDDYVFGLDIGTRNVVGTVGYKTDDGFTVVACDSREHESRAMLDGQIHDIGRVAKIVGLVKDDLEEELGFKLKDVCIAAAGRVLRTVTTRVEMDFDDDTVITSEIINDLDLMGVDQAQRDINSDGGPFHFYCVGYTTMKYYLNNELMSNLEGHKATKIEEVIIVTFLPDDVVDGLYSAVERADLEVANMTLEPIAAMNLAIPENFRMLNIALIDVGAGTSDICLTRDGSIVAYGMIPEAGDELTEVLVQAFLVDFAAAEQIKKDSLTGKNVTYTDIMDISHTIPAEDVWKYTDPVMERITTDVANKIIELNGDKPVAAAFVVGGGGKVHGFCESLAEKLGIIKERVALRGEEVMKKITFLQPQIKKDPLLVTPIGICLNYYEQKNNFIVIHFNGELMKLFDNGHLKIIDAAMQSGMDTDLIFPRRGKEIHYRLNGEERMIRGAEGESARVMMNGHESSLNTNLIPNADVTIESSTAGQAGKLRIDQLDEYSDSYVVFIVNGSRVTCPKFVEVNGSLEPGDYIIQDNDDIETRSFYTVGQLAAFMDVEVDPDRQILVNNREADMNTLIYENFTVDWTTTGFGINDGSYVPEGIPGNDTQEADEGLADSKEEYTEETADSEKSDDSRDTSDSEDLLDEGYDTSDSEDMSDKGYGTSDSEDMSDNGYEAASENSLNSENESESDSDSESDRENDNGSVSESDQGDNKGSISESDLGPTRPATPLNHDLNIPKIRQTIHVTINGEKYTMSDKEDYIFTDIFNYIDFDTNQANGRAVETTINGKPCGYVDPLKDGDDIRIGWVERDKKLHGTI